MIVLGIANNDLAGAAITEHGRLIAATSEERFNGIKDYKGWPEQSIAFVLSHMSTSLEAVDRIAYGWSAGFNVDIHLDLYLERSREFGVDSTNAFCEFQRRVNRERLNDLPVRTEFINWTKRQGVNDKISLIDHHECHAYGAFCTSPFNNALVMTCDARGDFQSLTISTFINDTCSVIHRETSSDSLGYFYGRITRLLGFSPNRHEGKVTGLAGYGSRTRAIDIMERMISVVDGRVRVSLGPYFLPYYDEFSDMLAEEIREFSKEDIAYAAQSHVESIICNLIDHYVSQTGLRNICLAGGVFANVKLNQSIAQLRAVDNIYVLPCMGDGGLAAGAAVAIPYIEQGVRSPIKSMALGAPFPDYDVAWKGLSANYENLKIQELTSTDAAISELRRMLLDFQIVGIVRGRAEFGPRALCNRSILTRPDYPLVTDELNRRLRRSDFMPFAPVVAADLASRCFDGWSAEDACAPYMTRTYKVTDFFRAKCPGAVHVDFTARPQVVSKESDEFIHTLLMNIFEESGVPSLINTSFNTHENPIVNSPNEVLQALIAGQIDALFVNDKWNITFNSR